MIPHLNPDAAVAVATLGILLIFVELNRPGRVLPGACGLLLTLVAAADLLEQGMRPTAGVPLLCCSGLFLLNLWRPLPVWLLTVATLVTIGSLRLLASLGGPGRVGMVEAIVCGGVLGGGSSLLTRVAYRARRSKALD